MSKTKKIEEIKETTIINEIDIDETNIEAETASEIKVKVFNKEYNISDLIELCEKKKRSYKENEIVKKFKLLMKNYYDGIEYALLMSERTYSLEYLKNKLKDSDSYKIIDTRCSRNTLRFDKETVDTVIKFAEKYNLRK